MIAKLIYLRWQPNNKKPRQYFLRVPLSKGGRANNPTSLKKKEENNLINQSIKKLFQSNRNYI